MKSFCNVAFWLLAGCLIVGCGGSSATAPVAEQDELAAYAAENPAPPETPVDE